MADKIDELLSDYFSGKIEMQIKLRKLDLQTPLVHDENIGGGKAQNKHVRLVDDILIREDEDTVLQELYKLRDQQQMITDILSTFDSELIRMANLRYDCRKRKYEWKHIALLFNADESTCRKKIRKFKKEFNNKFWRID
ncbi:DUF722 domain-containing protein [Leuconostoc mesenteroides]|uniref:DUF722 domain-containing protein n=1 Tax=Leuconostoc mesenteroides TaxID=1245 RepID=UPI002078BDA0|nr:DUF722 domain-containing protein [Leuconostoc mesenteroides]USI45397.1 RinA family protein [Leuconostoc mesenteroides]